MKQKNLLLIFVLQLVCGTVFSQTTDTISPKTTSAVVKDGREVYEVVDEPAEFRGGNDNFLEYLNNFLRYPESAREKGMEGKCYVQFVVTDYGKITSVKIVKGMADCPECDKEAVRVVSGMPNWKPGKIGGKAVNSLCTVPIVFEL